MDLDATAVPAQQMPAPPAAPERCPGERASTLCEAFRACVERFGDAPALRAFGGPLELSWREYGARVESIAGGLAALGLGRGQTVGMMLTNRPEFSLVDTAAMHLGATPFSLYNTSAPGQIEDLFSNAGNRVVVTEARFLDAVLAARRNAPAVEHVIILDGAPAGTTSLEQLEARRPPGFDFDATWRAVRADDVATLIYTSGTTGPPKGVQITHANVLAEWGALAAVIPPPPGGTCISYLPSAHIADRVVAHYLGLWSGACVISVADPAQLPAALSETHPLTFGAVPRVWEKLKAALEARLAAEPDAERRASVLAALEQGVARVRAEQAGERVPAELEQACARADGALLAPIRTSLGLDRARWLVCGAAPIPVEVLEFFGALGLPICEVWGMSETTAVATINPPGRLKLGSVGPALPGVELALLEDREVVVRGPIVMPGYRGDAERTAEALDAEGWLHTGDVGELDDDGYLRIVDRKKELIINAAGKNMSPANIEARLKASHALVGQAVAIGDARPYNTALIVLDPDACAAYASARGLSDASPAALSCEPEVRELVAAAVQEANSHLSRVEQIKRFELLDCDWLPGGDELTPTMKLRRRPIAEKYASQIEALYT